jgi:hypothetical protein
VSKNDVIMKLSQAQNVSHSSPKKSSPGSLELSGWPERMTLALM